MWTLINTNLKNIFKSYSSKIFKNMFLLGFLIFLLNLFLGISIYLDKSSDTFVEKVWVYLYIDDVNSSESQTYDNIIKIKSELEIDWIKTQFSSKEDAIWFLENKIPGITENFQQFNIGNPLPSTLYVTFQDKSDYQHIQSVVDKYKHLITNYKDLEKGSALWSQENNVITIVNFFDFINIVIFIIIILLFLTIWSIIHYFLEVLFSHLHNDMYRIKLMWASEWQTIWGLMITTWILILWAIVIWLVLNLVFDLALSNYVNELFKINILEYFINSTFWIYVFIEVILLFIISVFFSYRYLHKLDVELH